jgi:hypothetical protein
MSETRHSAFLTFNVCAPTPDKGMARGVTSARAKTDSE